LLASAEKNHDEGEKGTTMVADRVARGPGRRKRVRRREFRVKIESERACVEF
jgi:hypothetical protein